jgi:predicted RNA binding protein YcfA (HicA-like mRNA interferase family)
VVGRLEAAGFRIISQSGSHLKFTKQTERAYSGFVVVAQAAQYAVEVADDILR